MIYQHNKTGEKVEHVATSYLIGPDEQPTGEKMVAFVRLNGSKKTFTMAKQQFFKLYSLATMPYEHSGKS